MNSHQRPGQPGRPKEISEDLLAGEVGESDGGLRERDPSNVQGNDSETPGEPSAREPEVPASSEEQGAQEEEGQGHGVRIPRHAQSPPVVSYEDRSAHNLAGHVEYRNWCDACVQARGRAGAHHRRSESGNIPVLSWDYAYLGSRRAMTSDTVGPTEEECEVQGQAPLLVMGDSTSLGYYGAVHPNKGCAFPEIETVIKLWVLCLDLMGYKRVSSGATTSRACCPSCNA